MDRKDGTQSFSTSVVASDYKTIFTLKSELSTADAAKYDEKSTVTVEMQKWDKKTSDWSTKPTTTTYSSLAAAKNRINAYANSNGLTGDITVTSNTVYLLKDAEVTANAVSQKDKEAVLPVNIKLEALKKFDGTLSGTEGAIGNFKFTVEGEGEYKKTFTSPAYNDADGKIDFGSMSFTKEGEYTFTLEETKGTNADINYSDVSHTVYVKVEPGDNPADGMKATVTVDDKTVDTYTSQDTNTIEDDETITPKPVTIDVGTFVNTFVKTQISVNKIWDDNNNQDGKRPGSITVTLYKKVGDDVTTATAKTLTLTNPSWTGTFTNLPKYEGGKGITYSIQESEVTGYIANITGNVTDGFTVTNTHTPEKTSLTAQKGWNDHNNQDGKRSESVSIQLYQQIGAAERTPVTGKTVT